MKYKICVEDGCNDGRTKKLELYQDSPEYTFDLILVDVHIAKPIDAELLKKKIAEYCR